MKKFTGSLILVAILGMTFPLSAQESCPSIVENALTVTSAGCVSLTRDEVCYGHLTLEAEARSRDTDFSFTEAGDIVDLRDLQRLRLSPMDEATGAWGVALLRFQPDMPDILPGQVVTALMFGDVEMTMPEGTPQATAFTFKTGLGDAPCDAAPDSGILLRTPKDVHELVLRVNNVDILLSSTVYLQAKPADELIVSLLEGSATVTALQQSVDLPSGMRLHIPLDKDGLPADGPGIPEHIPEHALRNLPLWLLDDPYLIGQCSEGETRTIPYASRYMVIASDGPNPPDAIDAFSYHVVLEGQELPASSGLYLWQAENGAHIQQRFDAGSLDPGSHEISFVGNVSRQIETSEGIWGPLSWTINCTVIVGEGK